MNIISRIIGLNIVLALLLSSCVPAVAIIATGVVGTTIAGERTAGDRLNDNIIKLKINEAYIQAETSEIYTSVNVNVYEGRVLLTGTVKNGHYLNEAAQIAWRFRKQGVKEVINEIKTEDKNLKNSAKDILIAKAIRGKFLVEKDVKSINYLLDVSNFVVYILGVAQNQAERDLVLRIASSVSGVKKVVSHVILTDDKRRIAGEAD